MRSHMFYDGFFDNVDGMVYLPDGKRRPSIRVGHRQLIRIISQERTLHGAGLDLRRTKARLTGYA